MVIARPFAIGTFDVTRAQYGRFIAASGGGAVDAKCDWADPKSRGEHFRQRPDEPAVCVSWNDATAYAAWLTAMTGHRYRLPTEVEWEYAARAGSSTARPWGADISHDDANIGADVCCGPATGGRDVWRFTAPVGRFAPNRFGLYDMIGNVWQWTADCATDYAGAQPADCSRHMIRGGGWFHGADSARSAARVADVTGFRVADIGFRVARDIAPSGRGLR
jgi:formylglycine-generating enzyme required for sulfatase activity